LNFLEEKGITTQEEYKDESKEKVKHQIGKIASSSALS
jgi:hypothetical protein